MKFISRYKNKNKNKNKELCRIEENFPGILSFHEMLDKILAGGSISRFGDGEFNLILGRDIPFQKASATLASRLSEILSRNDSNLLVCIPSLKIKPPIPGFEKYVDWWKSYWIKNWNYLSPFLNNRTYGNAFFSREYVFPEIAVVDLKKIWDGRDVVFVVPKNGRFIYDNRLFENIKGKEEINVQPQNAFEEYDKILSECLKQSKDKLFFISAGPTATVLAADLSSYGYQALDMGHFPNCYAEYLGEADLPEFTPMVYGKKVDAPRVSVLMAAYKTNPIHLRSSINSILTQTFEDFELIILDDAPDDTSVRKIVESYSDSRIKYFRNDKNIGISGTRNRLLKLASESVSEFVIAIDHDDIQLPEKIEKMVNFLDNNPSIGAVGSWYYHFFDDTDRVELKRLPENNDIIRFFMMLHYPAFAHSSMVRKAIFRENNIEYRDEYSPGEDVMLWAEMIKYTDLHNIPEPLMRYRRHNLSVSVVSEEKIKEMSYKIKNFILHEYPCDVKRSEIERDILLECADFYHIKSKYKKSKKSLTRLRIIILLSFICIFALSMRVL